MQKLPLLLISLLLAFSAPLQAEDSEALKAFFTKLKAGEKQMVVAYGTSLTANGAWVKFMERWFEAQYPGQVTVVNSGGSGKHSGWGVESLEKRVLEHKPNLVFVEFSYNDSVTRFNLTPEQCRENLEKIVGGIQGIDPAPAIVLQTMNAPWDPPEGKGFKDSATNRPNLEAYNEAYRASAKEHMLPLVDNYPVWLEIREKDFARYQKLVPGGSHPSREGSEAITWKNVQTLLENAAK